MPETSLTLLERLRHPGQAEAWNRFVNLYAPLILRAELQGFQDADAEDLAQTVLLKLLRLLPDYRRSDGQSFRGWLFRVCRHECIDFRTRRATRALPGSHGLSDVPLASDDTGELDEAEYRRRLVRRALELVRHDFSAASWEAFTRFAIDGRRAADIARELGISSNAVYLARNRILSRLRAELAGMIE